MRSIKVPFLLAALAVLTPTVHAKVWITAYRCDEATPLEAIDPNHPTIPHDIMVGTRLVLIIRSDAPGVKDYVLWSGELQVSWDDWQRGTITGRGYNEKWEIYDGSFLPAAGWRPSSVSDREDPNWVGFDFGAAPYSTAGDWFVFDYHAQRVGTCVVGLYDLYESWDAPVQTLTFTHVPSRDLNGDTVVNGRDFALLASHWGANADPNSRAAAFDLDADRQIDVDDLRLFSEYWLQQTDCHPAAPDPNPSAHKQ